MVRVALKCPENCKLCDTIFRLPPTSSPEKSWYLATFVLKLFFSYCARWGANSVDQKLDISKKHLIFDTKNTIKPNLPKSRHFSEHCVPGPRSRTQFDVFMSITLPMHVWDDSGTVLAPLGPREHNPGRFEGRTTGDLYRP